jgi:hypothetical protein
VLSSSEEETKAKEQLEEEVLEFQQETIEHLWREYLWKEILGQREIYIRGQMDFVKWTVAISTGAIALGISALDSPKGPLAPLIYVQFAVGLIALFTSILSAVIVMNQWLALVDLNTEISELFYMILCFPLFPRSFWSSRPNGKAETESVRELYDEVKKKVRERDLLRRKGSQHFQRHTQTFAFGLLVLGLALVLSAF